MEKSQQTVIPKRRENAITLLPIGNTRIITRSRCELTDPAHVLAHGISLRATKRAVIGPKQC